MLLTLGVALRLVVDAVDSPSALLLFAIEVAIMASVGIVFYYRAGNVDVEEVAYPPSKIYRRSQRLWLSLVFVLMWSVALLLLARSLHTPTPFYYFALSSAAAVIGMEVILCSRREEIRPIPVLAKMVALGGLIQISFPLLSPKSVVSDPYFHWLGIEAILQSGTVPVALGYYFYFPVFHILNGVILQVGNLGFSAYAILNHGLMVLAIPYLYVFASRVVSRSKALLAALLLMLSPFFFLSIGFLPVLSGTTILLLAVFALLRYREMPSRRWWTAFWILATFVFFSHPVNALVLAGILVVFWVSHRARTARSPREAFTPPTATYSVSYFGYLMFLAVNAFALFIQSLVESGPRYYFARATVGTAIPPVFILQTVMGTLGFAILFPFVALAMFSWLFRGNRTMRFLVGVVLILIAIPTTIVLLGRGPYGLQAARALLYLNVLAVVPAASGLFYTVLRSRRWLARIVTIGAVVFLVAFLSSTSYLTGSGNRFLADSIPIQTNYVTDSMLAAGDFLSGIPTHTPLAVDPAMATSMAPDGIGIGYLVKPYSIPHLYWVHFATGYGNSSVVVALSEVYLANSGYDAPQPDLAESVYAVRAYDNGVVRIYGPAG